MFLGSSAAFLKIKSISMSIHTLTTRSTWMEKISEKKTKMRRWRVEGSGMSLKMSWRAILTSCCLFAQLSSPRLSKITDSLLPMWARTYCRNSTIQTNSNTKFSKIFLKTISALVKTSCLTSILPAFSWKLSGATSWTSNPLWWVSKKLSTSLRNQAKPRSIRQVTQTCARFAAVATPKKPTR